MPIGRPTNTVVAFRYSPDGYYDSPTLYAMRFKALQEFAEENGIDPDSKHLVDTLAQAGHPIVGYNQAAASLVHGSAEQNIQLIQDMFNRGRRPDIKKPWHPHLFDLFGRWVIEFFSARDGFDGRVCNAVIDLVRTAKALVKKDTGFFYRGGRGAFVWADPENDPALRDRIGR